MRSLFPITLTDVAVKRSGRRTLGPVNLEVGSKGLTIVMGPNGSGKTTLLRAMHGVQRLSEGQINWGMDPNEAQAEQAYVFQTPVMLRRSVADNLRYPLQLAHVARGQMDARVDQWLSRIGLSGVADTQATRLSGGERQKLALARALIRKPALLFLDEPCANLDGRSTKEIEAILLETLAANTRIIMATHDMGQAKRLATDAMFILAGRIHEQGIAKQFFEAPQTSELAAFMRGDIVE